MTPIAQAGTIDQKNVISTLRSYGLELSTWDWNINQLQSMVDLLHSLPPKLTIHHHRNFIPAAVDISIPADAGYELIQTRILTALLHQYDEQHKASESEAWHRISGWKRRWFSYVADNQDSRGYATPAGLKNPQEDFVSSALAFILPRPSTMEASIKCRLPEKYHFLKLHFSGFQSPLDRGLSCRDMDQGFLDDMEFFDIVSGKRLELGPINTRTVKGFELLYATPGTADASEVAGHLLLRIKLNNNPEADRLGIENPKDLVISFLADTEKGDVVKSSGNPNEEPDRLVPQQCKRNWFNLVNDGSKDFNALDSIFQSLKGLAGGFLTVMDRQPLGLAVKKYTVDEDRNLLRYELQLSEQQKLSLLRRLYQAKKNYRAQYFFFNQNCASVLVKVIGQGLGNAVIAQFDPLVSPPNALVGLFLRQGLAKPVFPSFYSYRHKAYLAQELMQQSYNRLTQLDSANPWPDITALRSHNDSKRSRALDAVHRTASTASATWPQYYQFLSLVQEAEMAYAYKELNCENYTSEVVALAREKQAGLLDRGLSYPLLQVSMDETLSAAYLEREQQIHNNGTPHTKLLTHSFGLQHFDSPAVSTLALQLEGALFKQDMGSDSSIAMQKAGQVALANTHLSVSPEGRLLDWGVTTLQIRKFKQRLNSVPGYFTTDGRLGLGLSLLKLSGDRTQDLWHGTLLGGELLFNLASSKNYQDYIYTSVGIELHRHLQPHHAYTRLMAPLHMEALMSFGSNNQWKWRTRVDYRLPFQDNINAEWDMESHLSYRFNSRESRDKDKLLINMGVSRQRNANHDDATQVGGFDMTRVHINLEMNWW
ncbi:MAG: DUF4105 domain-containing protein [Gammaproteobacteria bacterium]|nr:DUF4105 domain-containing protein [Gammaproteobacteria bacterium]MDH5802780.1 DUF4105 domain-containing protein [Gammaproteobacteria bacterium]